ncbi:MAG: YdcF family protein [Saprospiraceae bacterium]|nr:YdcF family protein [Saprospiraceae bacterium]
MNILTKFIRNIVFISICSIFICSCLSLGAGRSYKRFVKYSPYDAVIVPGVPFEDSVWSDVMKIRVHWAIYLYKKGITKNIIFSGSSVYSPYTESKIMALYAEKLGVLKENIFIEDRAEHSSENLYYSYVLARKNGLHNIALTTDPFQNSFLRNFAKKIMLDDISFMPIVFDSLKTVDMKTPVIDPSLAFQKDFKSITERESMGKRFLGTMGKYIIYEEGDDPKEKKKQKQR